jgi:hypothetical protein
MDTESKNFEPDEQKVCRKAGQLLLAFVEQMSVMSKYIDDLSLCTNHLPSMYVSVSYECNRSGPQCKQPVSHHIFSWQHSLLVSKSSSQDSAEPSLSCTHVPASYLT